MKNPRGFIVPLLIIVVAIVVIGGIYFYSKNQNTSIPSPDVVMHSSTTTDPTTGKIAYTNPQYRFSIQYPASFSSWEDNREFFFAEGEIFGLTINVPKNYQKNTDFNVGRIDISVSSSTKNCYSVSPNGPLTSIRKINGTSFYFDPQQPSEDDAMGGQRGHMSFYAAISNNMCYRIEELIGYIDSHGFVPPPYPPHFDEQKVNNDFDSIISSLKIY